MSFIENNLSDGEEVVIISRVSIWTYVPNITLLSFLGFVSLFNFQKFLRNNIEFGNIIAVFLLFLAINFLYLAGYNYFKSKSVEMAVTNKRVIYKDGIIAKNTSELRLEKVEGVSVEKNLAGTIFNYGNIVFTGVGNTTVTFPKIENPLKVKAEVDSLLNKFKV